MTANPAGLSETYRPDVLVIGSGAAGLSAAIAARQAGASVAIVSRTRLGRGGSTARAGGIVNAVTGEEPDDSMAQHIYDTIVAGRFIPDEPHVETMVEGIVDLVPRLERLGVTFVRDNGTLLRTRQAGHTYARTLLLQNHRGTDITNPLSAAAVDLGVKPIDGHVAVRILTDQQGARGAALLHPRTGAITAVESKVVVLATGGAGLFYTANGVPDSTPGDGYALALAAGCELTDLEFVQFYPTMLDTRGLPRVLLPYDYLLRHGAVLINSQGVDLSRRYSLPEPEMMTRADLAGAMGREMNQSRSVLYFDFRHFVPDRDDHAYQTHRFGRLVAREAARGNDILAAPLPVAPIVHHFMGGVCCDTAGQTNVPALLVCGEAAAGVHGANRLAGNAFTHALVSGFNAGATAATSVRSIPRHRSPLREDGVEFFRSSRSTRSNAAPQISELVSELRRILTERAGPCRSRETLQAGITEIDDILDATPTAHTTTAGERATAPMFPALVRVARLLLIAAQAREESRGAHVRADFATEQETLQVHLVHDRDGQLHTRPVAVTSTDRDFTTVASAPPLGSASGTVDQE